MFGLVRKKALIRYMKEIKDENRASNIYAKYPPKDNKQEKLNCYSQGYEDGTDNFYNVMVDIIRKHMNDKSETYAFDFANTEAFDCPCGRHYVHLAIPPKLEFCEKCKEKVRNNRTDICPKCRKKLYEYEKKYNCVVDIGMNGCDGARGEKYILPHGERRIN